MPDRSVAAALGKAGAAVNGTVGLGLERDLGGSAALCADRIVHHTLAAGSVLASLTAGLAAGGLILETLFGVKLLLAGGENEFSAAVLANQCLVFKHFGSF